MEYISLNKICDVRDGTHDSPQYVLSGYPLVTSKNIVDGKLDLSTVNYLSQEDYDKINVRSKVDNGDIIMPMIGTIGNPFLVNEDPNYAIKNVALIKFPNKDINNRFIWYFLKSGAFKKYVSEKNKGGTQKFLSLSDIRNMSVPLYSLDNQLEIVKKLDLISQIIDKRRLELNDLDRLIKARFVEMFGSIKEERLLGDISEFVTVGIANSATHAYAEAGIPMLRNQNIKENYLDDTDLIYITPEFAAKYETKKLKENDIIAMRTGYPGIACLVPKKYEGCQTFTTLIVRLKAENNPSYVCSYINSDLGKSFIEAGKVGVAQQNFGTKSLAKMPIKIAPKELQDDYALFVKQVDKSKSAVQKALGETQLLFDSLMQKYFG